VPWLGSERQSQAAPQHAEGSKQEECNQSPRDEQALTEQATQRDQHRAIRGPDVARVGWQELQHEAGERDEEHGEYHVNASPSPECSETAREHARSENADDDTGGNGAECAAAFRCRGQVGGEGHSGLNDDREQACGGQPGKQEP
jgi:hypothetical protein